jgi:hypothetical protein
MRRPFELSWLGGAAEKHLRRARPGVDDLPWGTLEPVRYPPALVDRARRSWTDGAISEYTTAAAFVAVLRALLEAGAPVDLIGMAGEFVADEMVHVELNGRVAMELGGGARIDVDLERLAPRLAPGLTPLQRASELVVRTSCVGEALSVPLLAGTMRAAAHPLTRAVLERIASDEAPHARLGTLYLEWAEDRIDDAERARLGRVASAALRAYTPTWEELSSQVDAGVTSEGFALAHVNELGWMESSAYQAAARRAAREHVVLPLARFGIHAAAA